jgi:glycosyltransferase involved in cell wall biosynthesis
MRVALIYDRLNKIGGAEAVLVQFAHLFPKADWYTSVWDPSSAPFSRHWRVHTSWINRLPFLRRRHELIPYLMPFIFESFDLSAYDLVISVGSAESKGVLTKPGTFHLNYCLTPTRYLYSHRDEYLTNPLYRWIADFLRRWDQVAATRPDEMIAISTQVKKRIKKVYNREVEIIFPPVDVKKFASISTFVPPYQDYYLTVARLVPYKRIDVLVKAFNQSGKTLVIIGTGSEFTKLTKLANSNIHLLGSRSDHELIGYYQHAKAFLQANEEDFGISMCESLAAGIPVIAYREGGAADIVKDGKTGILVEHPDPDDFNRAIDRLDTLTFDKEVCRSNAKRFDQAVWIKQIKERIDKL